MRAVFAAFGLAALVAAGCQQGVIMPQGGDGSAAARATNHAPAAAPAVPAAPEPAVAPPPAAVAAPPAAVAAAPPAPTHVRLPRSPETPARRTLRPLKRPQLGRLAAIEFPDFEHQNRDANDRMIEVRHITRTRPKLGITVMLGACPRPRACPSMQLARWNARRGELLHELPASLAGRPDTRFEIATRKVAGAAAISIYEIGYAGGADDHDQPSADYIDAYVVYYNDGVNQLRVMAHYLDDSVGGIEQMTTLAPREDLEKLAVAFASYYLHAWN